MQTRIDLVPSLLGAMQDGNEYQSIVDKQLPHGANLVDEIERAIVEIDIRGRPCLFYVGNVVRKDVSEAGIDSSDDPFERWLQRSQRIFRVSTYSYLLSEGMDTSSVIS